MSSIHAHDQKQFLSKNGLFWPESQKTKNESAITYGAFIFRCLSLGLRLFKRSVIQILAVLGRFSLSAVM